MEDEAVALAAALKRYRVIAYVVGVALVVLVFVAVPLKYAADQPFLVSILGPLHGFLYMAYLALAFDICHRSRWSLGGTGLVLLAGTIPFLSFVAERKVSARIGRVVATETGVGGKADADIDPDRQSVADSRATG